MKLHPSVPPAHKPGYLPRAFCRGSQIFRIKCWLMEFKADIYIPNITDNIKLTMDSSPKSQLLVVHNAPMQGIDPSTSDALHETAKGEATSTVAFHLGQVSTNHL